MNEETSMNLFLRIGLLALGVALWTLSAPRQAWAAGVVGTGSPASCDANDLAAALEDGGIVTFNCGATPHTLIANTHFIQEDTTIRGANRIRLDGEALRQLFIVDNDATLTLENITLQNGESGQGGCISVNSAGTLNTTFVTFRGCHDISTTIGGGAVYNLGTFNATDTVFESNRAEMEGGAVFNRGRFIATNSIFEANMAGDESGAISNEADGLVVTIDVSFIGNSAQISGGAVGNTLSFPKTDGSFNIVRALFVDNSAGQRGGAVNNVVGRINILNSTFVRNTANEGGALFLEGNTHTLVRFSTFFDNRADTGAAIYRPLTGVVEIGYNILAGGRNEADSADQLECDGPALDSLGFNLIEDGSCVDGNDADDMRETAPELGPLQDNGGFSQSIMPDATSPALGVVPARECVPHDQRGALRDGPCDIGAVERGGLFVSAYMPSVWR
jgi:hypothetical protein